VFLLSSYWMGPFIPRMAGEGIGGTSELYFAQMGYDGGFYIINIIGLVIVHGISEGTDSARTLGWKIYLSGRLDTEIFFSGGYSVMEFETFFFSSLFSRSYLLYFLARLPTLAFPYFRFSTLLTHYF